MKPSIVPMVSYEDPAQMADWLARAFGFEEVMRLRDNAGAVNHVEMHHAGGVILLGTPGPAYRSPSSHRQACALADEWLRTTYVVDGVLVRVPDDDVHYRGAVAAGATILSVPADSGPGRLYRVADPEGHRWMFIEERREDGH